MTEILIVYKGDSRIGELRKEAEGYRFCYRTDWLDHPTSQPLSLNLPLQPEPFTTATSRAFFANLLPEGQLRDYYARKFRVSPEDDFALLEALAGDCAGAISLYPPEIGPIPGATADNYRLLTATEQEQLLNEAYVMDPSFLGEEKRTRLSLAGMQDKLPIALIGGQIGLPLDGAPSSHILKPQNHRFPSLVENEAFCMILARSMGLDVPDVTILPIGDGAYVVARYDRTTDVNGKIIRLHQEDFCQALGVPPRLKYEINGGPGFADCFQLVTRCKNPLADRIKLLQLTFFNLLIGNADAHAKNISLLYGSSRNPSLAPCYDLVCTAIYDRVENEMAMKIGSAFHPRDIRREDWQEFVKQIGGSIKAVISPLRKVAEALPGTARTVAREMENRYGENGIYSAIIEKISERAAATLRCTSDM